MGALPMLFGQGGSTPPINPGGGMMGAFSQNPQFQDQLSQLMMNQQGPGYGPVQFSPPQMPVSMSAGQQQGPSFGGTGRMPMDMQRLLRMV